MRAKIATSKHCSAESGRAFILRPRPSRLLRAWLIGAHVLAALGVLCLPVTATSKAALLGVIAAHAYVRRPRLPAAVVRNRNGLWALPESGHTGLSLDPASRYGTWWAELRLVGGGRVIRCLLCRDQIRPGDWRLLQLALRRHAGRHDLS